MRPPGMLLASLLLAALVGANAFVSDAQVSPDVIEATIGGTVHLVTPVGETDYVAKCSGSFVTSFGLILTASHCVRETEDDPKTGTRKGQLLNAKGVSLVEVNLPGRVKPVPVLIAQLVADNPSLDIAVLKTVALLGRDKPGPLPSDFRVPFLSIADSDAVRIGDPIAVLGFPLVGGESITVTQGHVTGFTADEENNKTWLKHDAAVGQGHSGGPVINARGEQIGITSHARLRPQQVEVSNRAALTNRIPLSWARYFQGRVPGVVAPPQPPPPAPGAPPRPSPAPRPAPRPQAGAGFVIRGRVVDASSGAGIAGAVFIILRSGYTGQTKPTQADILASAQTDGNGGFQTSPPVRKGATYPMAVLARGYQPISDAIEIPADAPDVIIPAQPIPLRGQ